MLRGRKAFCPGSAQEERLCDFFGSYTSIYSWLGSREVEFVRQLKLVSQGRARIYPFHPDGNLMHQTDYYLSCLGERTPCEPMPIIELRPEAVAWAEEYWRRQSLEGKAVLVLAPGSGAREKNWPAEYFRVVARWWHDETRGAVVLVVGPVEEERGWEPLPDHSVVAQNLNLARVSALLVRADLYLGNDSGITHLAGAVGARAVGLFGPSDVRQWAPRGKKVTILNRNVECSPCELEVMKNCPHRKCLTAFPPEEVISKLVQLPELTALDKVRGRDYSLI
jgi:ADP-heptose:LPS heptosyltransferase